MDFGGRKVRICGAVDEFQYALEQHARRFVDVQVPFEFEFAGEETRNRVEGFSSLSGDKGLHEWKRDGECGEGTEKTPLLYAKIERRCFVKAISPEQRKKASF